jgi:hypothetical protein
VSGDSGVGQMDRTYLRLAASGAVFGVIMSVSPALDVATAYPGGENETAGEHAQQDLAGTSIDQTEKDTRANAIKIKKTTGAAPGGRTSKQNVPNVNLSSIAAQIPASAVLGAPSCRPRSSLSFRPNCRTGRC